MDLYFLDKNRQLVGIIDTAQSVQWLERYYEVGTFEVYVQVTDEILSIVNQSYFIARNDSKYVGVIEYIENEDNKENGNYLIIQGRMAESLIGRRIVRRITYQTNTLFDTCKNLLEQNILNPVLQEGETISPRKMDCLNGNTINELTYNPPITTQATYEDNLLEVLSELLKGYNSSLRLEMQEDNTFTIVLYTGADRSYDQTENPYVVFSKEYDNLLSSNYTFNSQEEYNALYVGGEDMDYLAEGRYVEKYELIRNLEGNLVVVTDIDRKELYVDAGDIKFRYADEWDEEEGQVLPAMTSTAYRRLLAKRAMSSVVNPSEELTGAVDLGMYVYGQDYFLGDIITIYNETLGAYTNKRLIGMDIVDDENGRTLDPTFENTEPIIEEETITNALLTESNEVMLTELGEPITIEEPTTYSTRAASSSSTLGVKISELSAVTADGVSEGCCMAIVSGGETKRITYGTLKEKLSDELDLGLAPMTNSEIENLLK